MNRKFDPRGTNARLPIISMRIRLTSWAIMESPPPPMLSVEAAPAAAPLPAAAAADAGEAPPAPLCRVITEQMSCAYRLCDQQRKINKVWLVRGKPCSCGLHACYIMLRTWIRSAG